MEEHQGSRKKGIHQLLYKTKHRVRCNSPETGRLERERRKIEEGENLGAFLHGKKKAQKGAVWDLALKGGKGKVRNSIEGGEVIEKRRLPTEEEPGRFHKDGLESKFEGRSASRGWGPVGRAESQKSEVLEELRTLEGVKNLTSQAGGGKTQNARLKGNSGLRGKFLLGNTISFDLNQKQAMRVLHILS